MKVKYYEDYDYTSLLKKIKNELGPGAKIINEKAVEEGFIFKRTRYEMVAFLPPKEEKSPQVKIPDNISRKEDILKLEKALEQISYKIDSVGEKKKHTKQVQAVVERLQKSGLDQVHIDRLLRLLISNVPKGALEDENKIEGAIRGELAGLIGNIKPLKDNPGRANKTIFVGPTGVGKTTTTSKIAISYSAHKKQDVGVVTLDTYRIAGVEQIQKLSDMAELPIEVAYDLEDMVQVFEKYKDKDHIFIDTTGRSQYDFSSIVQLKSMVVSPEVDFDEIVLVMSANTKYADMLEIYNSFNILGVTKIIFTKLDETQRYGNIVSFALENQDVPLSYVTVGQTVPNDIEKINVDSLISNLLSKNNKSFLKEKVI